MWFNRKYGVAVIAFVIGVLVVMAGCGYQTQPAPGSETASASEYPTKPIEYVVPYSAGGGVDLVARATAEYLSKEWGQPIVVVNKPGGGGTVGAEYALKQAKNDGYTVLANNVSNTSMLAGGMANPAVKIEDNLFVSRIAEGTMAFAVKTDAPWKDFREFSEWVKQNPEQLTWTTVGPAGFSAFGVAEWLNTLGVDYQKTRMIVTKGGSESLPKVAGGHAVLAVHMIGETHAMVQAGKVKILAVGGTKRSPFLPDVPTAEEQGIKGLTVKWWTGVSMPKGTPEHVVKKWEAAIAKMTQDPAFIEKLQAIQVEPSYANSADFTSHVQQETGYYTDLATKRGIRK
jgi:tripartite-type tricarboxylate transporter receptor subunit TctC